MWSQHLDIGHKAVNWLQNNYQIRPDLFASISQAIKISIPVSILVMHFFPVGHSNFLLCIVYTDGDDHRSSNGRAADPDQLRQAD